MMAETSQSSWPKEQSGFDNTKTDWGAASVAVSDGYDWDGLSDELSFVSIGSVQRSTGAEEQQDVGTVGYD